MFTKYQLEKFTVISMSVCVSQKWLQIIFPRHNQKVEKPRDIYFLPLGGSKGRKSPFGSNSIELKENRETLRRYNFEIGTALHCYSAKHKISLVIVKLSAIGVNEFSWFLFVLPRSARLNIAISVVFTNDCHSIIISHTTLKFL